MYVLNLGEIVLVLVVSPALPTDIDIQTRTIVFYLREHKQYIYISTHISNSILFTVTTLSLY